MFKPILRDKFQQYVKRQQEKITVESISRQNVRNTNTMC